jgi:hypothetical protein
MAAIFSPDGRGWTAKYASRERFSGAAMDVLFLEKRLDIDYLLTLSSLMEPKKARTKEKN